MTPGTVTHMPKRIAITISLDPDTLALVDAAVTAGAAGNRSAAIKAFIADAPASANPQVSAPEHSPQDPAGPADGHAIVISEAGWAALARIAADAGKDPEDVARLGLRYAVQYPTRWL